MKGGRRGVGKTQEYTLCFLMATWSKSKSLFLSFLNLSFFFGFYVCLCVCIERWGGGEGDTQLCRDLT